MAAAEEAAMINETASAAATINKTATAATAINNATPIDIAAAPVENNAATPVENATAIINIDNSSFDVKIELLDAFPVIKLERGNDHFCSHTFKPGSLPVLH